MIETKLKSNLKVKSYKVYEEASKHCKYIKTKTQKLIKDFLTDKGFDEKDISFIAVGSIGRNEALQSSDLDLIPVLKDKNSYDSFIKHDQKLREHLRKKLGIDVSKGEELTRCITLNELISADTIGGRNDDSDTLTKRILILSESIQVGGKLSIKTIRERILKSYATEERTSGRHVLSLCNDLVRYYRTLCIEYKAKVDKDGNWCKRNLKLRHSRKFWYFSNIVSIITLAESHPRGNKGGDSIYLEELLHLFDRSPVDRLVDALIKSQPIEVAYLLESYSFFLEFMSEQKNRDALHKIKHENRYKMDIENPFPALKYNSDIFHQHIINLIDGLPPTTRRRMINWFLL